MTAGIFSFMAGIFHEYYTVALAPYIAALVGMGATVLWEERRSYAASAALGGTVAVTAYWSYTLLGRSTDYLPWLRWAVLIGGLVAAAGLLLVGRIGRQLALGAAALGLVASLAGPLAYSLTTVSEAHAGSIVTAGPAVAGGRGGPGGPGGGGPGGRLGGDGARMQPPGQLGQGQGQGQGAGQQGGGMPGAGMGQPPTGGQMGQGQAPQGQGQMPGGFPGVGRGERGAGGGGMGGLLNGANVNAEVEAKLKENAGDYTWIAAAIGSQNAASYQLATEKPVMAIGGFNGSDPSPSLAQFKQYVADGKIHYFISGGQGGGPGGSGSSGITTWVEATFTKVTVDGTTLYDLTDAK